MNTSIVHLPEELENLREHWVEGVTASHGSLYSTYEWVTSLWHSHYNGNGVRFVVNQDGDELQSIFPLTKDIIQKYSLKFCQYGLLTNVYGQNHNDLLLFRKSGDNMAALFDYINQNGWDILFIGSVLEDSSTLPLFRECQPAYHYRLILEPYVSSPYLLLEGTWEEYLKGQSNNFRSDIRRKWNKLNKAGAQFKVYRQPQEVELAKTEIFQIEANSWKEGSRTSITTQPKSQKFYDFFLPQAAMKGWVYLVILYLEGCPVAYDMGVIFGKKYYMLKTSYDLRWKEWSPGIGIRQFVLQELFKMGIKEHDFLGEDEGWKMRWTKLLRKHWNLYLYNTQSIKSNAYSFLRQCLGR